MKKRAPRLLLFLIAGLILLPIDLFLVLGAADRTYGTLTSSGEKRRYLLHIPKNADLTKPIPLVITLHGFAQWPANQANVSQWNALADAYGFLVVYPSGTGFPKRWDAASPAADNKDIRFLSDLIDALESTYPIDPTRIYINGLSNGGGMSVAFACAFPERAAAFGSVAGAYVTPLENCRASRAVPAVIFHGDADPIVPFNGGQGGPNNMLLPDIDTWVSQLAAHNGCSGDSEIIPTAPGVKGTRFEGCAADLEYYVIAGGGHTWPGGNPLPEWITGKTSDLIDASAVMWDFFQQHPLSMKEAPESGH